MHNWILFPQQGSFCETAGGGEARQGSPTSAEQSSFILLSMVSFAIPSMRSCGAAGRAGEWERIRQ